MYRYSDHIKYMYVCPFMYVYDVYIHAYLRQVRVYRASEGRAIAGPVVELGHVAVTGVAENRDDNLALAQASRELHGTNDIQCRGGTHEDAVLPQEVVRHVHWRPSGGGDGGGGGRGEWEG